jgi:hypothetical protein
LRVVGLTTWFERRFERRGGGFGGRRRRWLGIGTRVRGEANRNLDALGTTIRLTRAREREATLDLHGTLDSGRLAPQEPCRQKVLAGPRGKLEAQTIGGGPPCDQSPGLALGAIAS